ncbi:MAG: DUF721 domain-containing protein [Alphaproteobacteria bacterium]|nr:MAG: DUF721 domain-containing protein [Alphaproteobacteria bacterium]
MKHIKHGIDKALRQHKNKRGFLHGRLLAEWDKIVEKPIAKMTQPSKVICYRNLPGVLVLNTTSSSSLFLHTMEEEIIQKINTYFGKELIKALRYKHVLKLEKPVKKIELTLSEENLQKIDLLLEDFEDGEMKDSLERLGKAILLKQKKDKLQ